MTSQFNRNYPIISYKTQKELSALRIGIIGCGLGSNIAVLAARTGFKNFVIADGDRVEHSNLNRQQFDVRDVGHNKAHSLKKWILRVHTGARVRVLAKYIVSQRDIEQIAAGVDVVVNTADFDKSFYIITKRLVILGKTVILPLNVGYGSVITTFNKKNIFQLSAIAEYTKKGDGLNYSKLLLKAKKYYSLPAYFGGIYKKIITPHSQIRYIPQLGVAAQLTAGEVVTMLVKYIQNESLPMYPRVWSADLRQ
jgi:hypothetical protein